MMIVLIFVKRVERYVPDRIKRTWNAPCGIPRTVVRRELLTRPLMMSLPNWYYSQC